VRFIALRGNPSLAAWYPSRIRPVDSIRQLIPVFTLRTTARRFSTARNAQIAACWDNSLLGVTRPSASGNRTNQPSLLMLTSQSIRLLPSLSRAKFRPT
jgi:hypothetical protein